MTESSSSPRSVTLRFDGLSDADMAVWLEHAAAAGLIRKAERGTLRATLPPGAKTDPALPGLAAPPKRFTAPTLELVLNTARELGLPETEAVKFFDYQTAVGWRVGRNPMKDWVAALKYWCRRASEFNRSGTATPERASLTETAASLLDKIRMERDETRRAELMRQRAGILARLR